MKGWNIKDLENSPVAHLNPHLFEKPKQKRQPASSKQKAFMQDALSKWALHNSLELKAEVRFFEYRKWRFDWAIESEKIAFEYEGIFSDKSRHTTAKGFSGDAEKYNKAASLGWKVYRYTALTYKNIEADLNELIKEV